MRRPIIEDRKQQKPDIKPTESRWVVRYWTGSGYKRKRFKRRKDAEVFRDEYIREHDGTRAFDPDAGKDVFVSELFASWIAAIEGGGGIKGEGAEPSTLNSYRTIYRNSIGPRWDRTALANITREGVSEWVTTMTAPDGKPATTDRKRKALGQFKRMLAFAVERGIVRVNPAEGVKAPPAATATPIRPLAPRQLMRLAAHSEEWGDLILFAGITGLRFGELAALPVQDIDTFDGVVVVTRAIGDDNGRRYVKTTKTGEERTVPLAPNAVQIATARARGKNADDLLFPASGGHWLHGSNFTNRVFRPLVADASVAVQRLQEALGVTELRRGRARFGEDTERAVRAYQDDNDLDVTGIADAATRAALGLSDSEHPFVLRVGDEDFEPIGFHGLRHTAVSLAIQAGANVKAVQRFAGHASASMTLDVYAELFNDDLSTVAERLGTLFRREAPELAGLERVAL